MWFREDLRLADNPALAAAVAAKAPVLLCFVLDEAAGGPRANGGAARWWLHGSLESLAQAVAAKGGALYFFRGDAGQIIPALARETGATAVFWNERYDKAGREQDASIKTALSTAGCRVETFNGKLLTDPQEMQTRSGTSFRVFTPFRTALLQRGEPPAPCPEPRRIHAAALPARGPEPVSLAALDLLPKPDWAAGLREIWRPGEANAATTLRTFLATAPENYAEGRDRPADEASSRLSPHLAAGRTVVAPGLARRTSHAGGQCRRASRHREIHVRARVARLRLSPALP